jgi:hypothetical protein
VTAATVTCSGGCLCQPSTGTSSGTISDGTSDYTNNANCNWLIASSGLISLSFSSFNTESGYDVVTINRCTSSSSCVEQVASLSGSSVSLSTIYTSSTGYMQVVFTSDGSVLRSGFVASWSVPSTSCTCNAGWTSPVLFWSTRNLVGAGVLDSVTNGALYPVTLNYGWGAFMNEHAVWLQSVNINVDVTTAINLPSTSMYELKGNCDNRGMFYIDGNLVMTVEGYSTPTITQMALTAGQHTLRIVGENFGSPAGVAFSVKLDGGPLYPCAACVAGKYKALTGTSACTDCGAGTYSTAVGSSSSSTCIACPSNSTSPAGSANLTSCTCNAGSTGPNGGPCAACGAGTYSAAVGSSASSTCIACPSNSTSPPGSAALTSCTCNAGYFVPFGAPASTFRLVPVQLRGGSECSPPGGCCSCYQMAEFRFKDIQGNQIAPVSVTNPGGQPDMPTQSPSSLIDNDIYSKFLDFNIQPVVFAFNSGVSAMSYEWVTADDASARDMISWRLEGKFFATDTAWTTLHTVSNYNTALSRYTVVGPFYVDAGTYSASGRPCIACEAGAYQASTGSASCTACPSNSTSPAGSANLTNCTCNAGSTGPNGGPCALCVAGKYKTSTGSAVCAPQVLSPLLPVALSSADLCPILIVARSLCLAAALAVISLSCGEVHECPC